MKKKFKIGRIVIRLAVISITMLMFHCSSYASVGKTALDFLNIGVGARPVAMGEAFVAHADDANAVFWNPAGLGQLKRNEVTFMHNIWLQDITYNYLAYAHTLKYGTLGVSFYHLRYGEIQGYDVTGSVAEKLSPYDLTGAVSFGTKIINRKNRYLFIGTSVKYIYEYLDSSEADTYAVDMGCIYKMLDIPVSLGVTAQNIGAKIKFEESSEELPLNVKAGTGLRLFGDNIKLAFDYTFAANEEDYFSTGGEYRFLNFLFVRLGFRSNQSLDNGLRYGMGVSGRSLSLDYSYVPYSDLGDTHRFSCSLRFGSKYGNKKIENIIEKQFEQAKLNYYQGQLMKAYRNLKEILAVVPGHEGAQDYLARTRVKIESGVTAQEIDTHIELGKRYFKNNEYTRAQAEFELILLFDPDNELAKDFLTKISSKFEEIIIAIYERGAVYYEKGDYNLAQSEMQKILSFKPDHKEAIKYLALIKEKQEEIEKYKRQQKAEELLAKGRKFFQNGKFRYALERFSEAGQLAPANEDIKKWINVTSAKIRKIEEKKAKEELARKQKLAEENYSSGIKLFNVRDFEGALNKFKEAHRLNPEHNQAKQYLDETRNELDKINKEKAEKYNMKGLIEYNNGNIKKAIDMWKKAIDLDSENEEAKSNLERARKEFKK